MFCFDHETRKSIKFMHSLVGCFLISEPIAASIGSYLDCNEYFDGKVYKKIELKLSQLFKRVFYVETEREFDNWVTHLKTALNKQNIYDYYTKGDLLGQGSFGKVYKGKSRTTDEVVAIKYIDKKAMKPHEI